MTVDVPARARTNDPTSSHSAASLVNVTGETKAQQTYWLKRLCEYLQLGHKDVTRSELAEWRAQFAWEEYKNDAKAHRALITGEIQQGKAQIGRRFPELREAGLVKVSCQRICNITGSLCQAWTINPIGKAAVMK